MTQAVAATWSLHANRSDIHLTEKSDPHPLHRKSSQVGLTEKSPRTTSRDSERLPTSKNLVYSSLGAKKGGRGGDGIGKLNSGVRPRRQQQLEKVAGKDAGLTSHQLTTEQLKNFSKVTGHLPAVRYDLPDFEAHRLLIEERIRTLDEELKQRVGAFSQRCEENKKRNAFETKTRSRLSRIFNPGVLQHIVPEIIAYLIYSFGLQYYAWSYDWDFNWSAANQDTIYYPALVMAFLLSIRAQDCMHRWQMAKHYVLAMEKELRLLTYEVVHSMPNVGLKSVSAENDQKAKQRPEEDILDLKRRYFLHELRRMARMLLTVAARDLADSALDEEGDPSGEASTGTPWCSQTAVENALVRITNSGYGHTFRVYLVSSWLSKLVKQAQLNMMFDSDDLAGVVNGRLTDFNSAWLRARQIAYSSMPESILHLLWLLATMMSIVLPWEYVSVCRWLTFVPSLAITISFHGILRIASHMENPFGFDPDDLDLSEVVNHLDEETCLLMYYAGLDGVSGENMYRCLFDQENLMAVNLHK